MVAKVEKIFKALGDKSRLRIINMLSVKSLCVCEMTEVVELSQSTVSGHLRVLKDAGLVEDKKDGLWVEYRLNKNDDFIAGILDLTLNRLNSDKIMEEERNAALKANRAVICKS
jgi:ArsR family transcriptional regulator